jgi:hypothetical protein
MLDILRMVSFHNAAYSVISLYSGPPHNDLNSFHENLRYEKNLLCEFGKYMLKAQFVSRPS